MDPDVRCPKRPLNLITHSLHFTMIGPQLSIFHMQAMKSYMETIMNIIPADTLAPCIARLSAVVILTVK